MISIIVPVYKVEKYLSACLDSLVHQTYENLEIILVDDASPDGCGEICDSYAAGDKRIVCIHKEKNAGQAAARNTGMDIAKGDYLFFVDSDDWLADDALEKLYEGLKRSHADCCVGGCVTVPEEDAGREARPGEAARSVGEVQPGEAARSVGEVRPGEAARSVGEVRPGEAVRSVGEVRPGEAARSVGEVRLGEAVRSVGEAQPGGKGERCETSREAMRHVLLDASAAWNRLCKRDFLRDLRFPLGRVNDDECFILHAYERMEKIAFLDCATYFYRKRANSITTSAFSVKMADCFYNSRDNLEFVTKTAPELIPAAEYKYCKSLLWCYVNLRRLKGDEKAKDLCGQFRREIRQSRRMALANPHLGLSLKILALLCQIL